MKNGLIIREGVSMTPEDFDPDLHFTYPPTEANEALVAALVERYRDGIAAIARLTYPFGVSVELQFDDEKKLDQCRKEYEASPEDEQGLHKYVATLLKKWQHAPTSRK